MLRKAFLTSVVAGAVLAASPIAASAATTCARYASPTGSDSASGSLQQPFRTVQKLAGSLPSGSTGCLRAGTYSGALTIRRASVALVSSPGERATIAGRLYIAPGADHVRVANLNLQGANAQGLPSPTVAAAYATFTGDDVTNNHTSICFDLGPRGWGSADYALLQGNRIHGCGLLPAANHDHGIYVEDATGVQILDNVISANADRGINLYWNAQNTTIAHNVIDGNGEGILFSGDFGFASSGTDVAENLITNSVVRSDVESWWPVGNPIGTANMVHDNCLDGARTFSMSDGGFAVDSNRTVDPGYMNAAGGDYRLQSASPCAGYGPRIAVAP